MGIMEWVGHADGLTFKSAVLNQRDVYPLLDYGMDDASTNI
jgi:hypothetical protein